MDLEEEKQVGEVVEQVVERLEERRGPRQAIQVELEYAFNYQGCTPRLVPQGIELPHPTPQKLRSGTKLISIFCVSIC